MKLLTFLLLAAFLVGCQKRSNKPITTGLEGKSIPELSLLLTDSITYINTGNIPEGRPVVLFYFSPQCPYCRAQVADIIEDIDVLKDIRFFMVTGFPVSEMKRFFKEYQLEKYPNITIGRDSTEYLAHYFKVPGVPYMAIYGKDKRLRNAFAGLMPGRQIKEVAMK